MTYHLSALRFRSVGERSARFTDLTLDLTAPTDDGSEPQDSVIWLRNGGGKSSILSLLYAQLLPHANDFMGRSVKRSLTDYVDTGDTSHIVAMWEPTGNARPLLGEVDGLLITGVVHEWADLRRPAQPESSRDRLSTGFYAFHVIPGVIDLATLPFTDESGRPRRLTVFLEELREQVRPHVQRASLVVTAKQHEWTQALLDRHLDPEIFRTQKQMNHVEGGVEDLFKFPAAKDFIDFLLDLTTQPDAADSVATRLNEVTKLLAAKPAKLSEQKFCEAAARDLDAVAIRFGEVQAANNILQHARETAAHLAAAFRAAVAVADEEQATLREEEQIATQARTLAVNDRNQAYELLYLYRCEAARLRILEARAEEQAAAQDADEASALVRAWETVGKLAKRAELTAALTQAKRDAAAEETELAPLREAHARHAALFRIRLGELSDAAEVAADTAAEQRGRAEEDADREGGLAEQARSEQRDAAADVSKAEAFLDALDARRREGVAEGHLPSISTSPESHLVTITAARDGLLRELTDLEGRVKNRRARRGEIRDRESVLGAEHSTADKERAAAADRRRALNERLGALTATPRVRELTEASQDDDIDLWGEASVLLRRLSDAVIAVDDERIVLRAEQQADQRTIDSQERNQYLPTSLDAELVWRALVAGTAAQTGWDYLRASVPAEQLVTALNIPAVARLGCGVVVPTESANDAVRLLDANNVTTVSLIGVYTVQAADALVRSALAGDPEAIAPVWVSIQPGLVDPDEAEAAVRQLTERAIASRARDQELAGQRDADSKLNREIEEFLRDCPAGHLSGLTTAIDRADAALTAIQEERNRLQGELDDLDAADAQDDSARTETSQQLSKLGITMAWLQSLIPAARDEAEWRERLTTRTRHAHEAGIRASEHASNQLSAAKRAKDFESVSAGERRKAQEYRIEAARMPDAAQHLGIVPDPTVPLDTLRRSEHDARTALEVRAAQSVLADRVQRLTHDFAVVKGELALCSAEDQRAASHLLASPAGQEPGLRTTALNDAKEAERGSAVRLGAARGAVSQRQAELETERGRRANPPRRLMPTIPTDPEEADALASDQETLSQEALARSDAAEAQISTIQGAMRQIETRQQLLGTLLDSLPLSDAATPTAEPFAGSVDEARANAHAARTQVNDAAVKVSSSEDGLASAVEQVRRTSGQFPKITGPIKDRVTHDPSRVLAPHAGDLAARLRLRADMLAGELESITKDQVILSEALADLVRESLDILGRAERASQMNTASGSWAGRRILRISFDRPDDANLVVYSGRVIDKTVEKGLKPEGMPLLKAAVHEAASPRGFTVKVLKPTDDANVITEDISRIAKWSGGEKLTVCVALYCTLAALRAARTGRNVRSGGVLLLDNPIGRASSTQLVRLQRDVAASHGIQLVYTTGVKDPAAVIQFPNVIRLDNRQGRTHNRRYIVTEADDQDASHVAGVRVAHADHRWDSPVTPEQEAE